MKVLIPGIAGTLGQMVAERLLEQALAQPGATLEGLAERFLADPLYSTDYRHGQGTLYTAVYRPARRLVEYRWRDRWMVQSIDAFSERHEVIRLSASTPS